MNPYAPPKAAEKIMNERTVKVSHGWRRMKRRIRILTRKTRPIANSPEIAFWQRDRLARPALRVPRRAPCAADNHAAAILKKCLRRCDVVPSDENMVDKALRRLRAMLRQGGSVSRRRRQPGPPRRAP